MYLWQLFHLMMLLPVAEPENLEISSTVEELPVEAEQKTERRSFKSIK